MRANKEYKKLFDELSVKTLEKLVEDKRASGEPFDTKLLKVLEESSILFSQAMTPIIYKLEKIRERNPDFKPKRIILSEEALSRIKIIQNLKLIPAGNKLMDISFTLSKGLKKEVYCKFV